MADDVLGHEHLDHGRHLHKHHHTHHGHVKRPVRDTRLPRHIGVLRETHAHHHSHHKGQGVHWKIIVAAVAVLVPLLVTFYSLFTALALAIIILGLDVLIEMHKWYTEGMPIDLEILSAGVAYMSAVYSVGWGVLLAIVGPVLVGMSHNQIDEGTIIRALSYLAIAISAMVLGPEPITLFAAVLVGLAVRAAGSALVIHRPLAVNLGGRLTTALVSAYVIFLILPRL